MFRQKGRGTAELDVAGFYHCGPDHTSPKKFDYEVEVHYRRRGLDDRGFLMDNLSFQVYFQSLERLTDSCELMSMRAAEYFWLEARGRCVWVRVAVWGIKDRAVIEYELDCHPSFVRIPGGRFIWRLFNSVGVA